MEQYYLGFLMDRNGRMRMFGFDGWKLTEFSFVGDEIVRRLMRLLEDQPSRLGLIGSLAGGPEYPDVPMIEILYPLLWQNNLPSSPLDYATSVVVHGREADGGGSRTGRYINSLTKNEYIDMEAYMERVTEARERSGIRDAIRIIHPLPILCAAGNGRGLGDYYGPDEEHAGRWCMDEIAVRNVPPADGTEITCTFPGLL